LPEEFVEKISWEILNVGVYMWRDAIITALSFNPTKIEIRLSGNF